MEQRCHLPLPKGGLSRGPVYKGAVGHGEQRGGEVRGGGAVSGAGPAGWDGEGRGGKGDLGCFPTSSCSLSAAVGRGDFPPPGYSWTCLLLHGRSGAAVRLCSFPPLGRAGISLGGRADSEESRRNPVFPHSSPPSAFTYPPFSISLCFEAGRLG